jgi:peptide/nickel transport system substrate-binding protein
MNRLCRTGIAAAAAVVLLAGVSACSGSAKKRASATGNQPPPASVSASVGASGSNGATSTHKQGGSVTIANVGGQTWTCQFNPFNPAANQESLGFVYEPLVYVNILQNSKETPMLATGYKWAADKKSVVFTIRDGVTWSDGKPFTAADVAFTFNLMKKFPATDLYSLWTGAGMKSVTASGNKVTMTFNQSAQPYFFYFADEVGIVPQHVWAAGDPAAHPDTWADKDPVGTGPYMVNPCSSNNITYTANPKFWQSGKPYITTVKYPAYLDNAPANNNLADGSAQWGSQFIPNIQKFYLDRSSDNHTWSPPVTNVTLYPNNDSSHPTGKLGVRQAIAYALDRSQVAQIGEGGQQPAANQTGIVMPTFQKWIDTPALNSSGYAKQDVTKAKAALQTAGYSTSHPLNLSVITVTGYTDWDASLAVIKQQLAPIGINLTVQDLAQQTYDNKLYTGDFDLAYYGESGGPTPYYELRKWLYSKNSAPLGKNASSNFERYNSASVDALFNQYPSASASGQVTIVKKIEQTMLKEVPVIPVTESVDWFQYNTANIGGWPTEQDPYAQPAAFNVPDVEQVLLHIYATNA